MNIGTRLKKRYSVGIIVACCGLGIVGGSAIATAAQGNNAPSSPSYSVNDSGETYGSARSATSPAEEPDLIEAMATNGEVGYVRGSDLTLPATTPEDNIRNNDVYARGFTIPVYASDGKTVIGEFVVGGKTATTPEEAEKITSQPEK